MKKSLVFLTTVASLMAIASNSYAAGTSSSTAVGTASTPVTSIHTGSVPVQCTINVTNGFLTVTALNVIDSASFPGLVTTKCNTSTSKLDLSIDTGNSFSPTQPSYTQEYKLENGTGAYASGGSGSYSPTAAGTYTDDSNTVNNLSNGFVNANSTVTIKARGSVPSGSQLAAGGYQITVNATITP